MTPVQQRGFCVAFLVFPRLTALQHDLSDGLVIEHLRRTPELGLAVAITS